MLDLFSDDARRNPYPLYEQLRSTSPLLRHEPSDVWLIFDYEGVKRALADYETFGSNVSEAAGHPHPDWLIFSDPPRQTKLRGLISRAFTPAVIASLEPRLRELSCELLDRVIDRDEMDVAGEFAVPLPMTVIAEMIGIPAADWPRFRRWSDAILKLSYTTPLTAGGTSSVETEEAIAASREFFEAAAEISVYVKELIAERRAGAERKVPNDLLTGLAWAELDGERLTEEEIIGFFQLLLVAGQETTANLINNAVLCFMEHPKELERLRRQPELLPSAIEEVLRYRSPVQWMFRGTRREARMHGQVIPAGKLVLPMIGSANRDPTQFPDPDQFDIAREPNAHIAFGHGVHFCLGASLARLEAKIALTEFLRRIKNFRPASTEPWEPRKALHVHGPSKLPIRFERTA